jgi:hypothetical protein
MKPHRSSILQLSLLLLASPLLIAASDPKGPVYTTAEAKDHVGEVASVVGVVQQVSTSSKGTQFLNFDGTYPDAPFSAVVLPADNAAVGDLSNLEGKKVSVTGKITTYHDKPEILIKSKDAVSVP